MSQKNSEKTVCKVCGKTLTRVKSLEAEIGHRCDTLQTQGWTGEKLVKHYAKLTGPVPDGYVKVATFKEIIPRSAHKIPGLSIGRFVKAIGKDRHTDAPAHPICVPVYDSRRHRWVNGWLATQDGLKAIASSDFSKAPTK